jgi:hypothetical protein
MSKSSFRSLCLFACAIMIALAGVAIHAQEKTSQDGLNDQSQKPLYTPQEEGQFLRWAVPTSDQSYASIDGNHLHEYVKEFTDISLHYRDQGHQLWGRISGTESDAENRKWLVEKFRQAGLSNIHEQPLDLPPQWFAQSWAVTAQGNGKSLSLQTAQPTYGTPGTPPEGLDLEAVYVGLGSEADFVGRDVRGKAVFLYSMPLPSMLHHTAALEGATKRAEDRGAAAIFIVLTLPGNIRTQMYPQGTKVPTFSMGLDDGQSVRDLIGQAPAGQPPRISIRMDVKMVSDLKTATVWGELPGTTDENIMIVAHRDGWFEGATDDASGVATMLGIAEYYAKIPKAQRRRTITFLGTTGHHTAGGSASGIWLAAHKEVFAKTALLINCEHTAVGLTYVAGSEIRTTNGSNALFWYVGGSPRLQELALNAFDEFGIVRYTDPEKSPPGEIGSIYKYAPSVQLIDIGMFNHSDRETEDVVPPTGLAAVTRAYAKIISDVNKIDLKDLLANSGTTNLGH